MHPKADDANIIRYYAGLICGHVKIIFMKKTIGSPQDHFYARSNIVPLPLIVRAAGVRMWDEHGREYIDLSSGPVVSNIGHGNERVAEAMAQQARTMDFAYSRVARHQPNMDLTGMISALAGEGYESVALASGGSEAMEIALKFLRQYVVATGNASRKKIITLSPSYHGGTIATLGITGDPDLDTFLDGFAIKSERIPAPWQYRLPEGETAQGFRMKCADALEEKIHELGAENVLCFVVEPIGGLATGAMPMEPDYLNRIRQICTRYGIYLVYDEILCGTGRSGDFLASHCFPDARADLVVLAKGLGSGYAPLGAVLMPGAMVDELAERTGFNYSHTYNANPISCAVGVAVLKEYQDHGLMENARLRGAQIKSGLEKLALSHRVIGDVRGRGLLLGVELVTSQRTKEKFPPDFPPTEHIRRCGLNHGLIIYSRRTANGKNGDWFIVAPPLTITEDETNELLERLSATLHEFETLASSYLET